MKSDFTFNHMQISLVDLQAKGIRSTKELEEAFGNCESLHEISTEDGNIFFLVDFSNRARALKYAFRFDENVVIHSLQAEIASRKDIKTYFCKKKTDF